MKPTFFPTPAHFRRWLEKNHAKAGELWVGFYRKGSGRPSITWPESVDEALCFGWIDGVRKSLDEESYVIRFTPRRAHSIWSNVNTKRAKELIAGGRMKPAGLKAFEARDPKRSGVYQFEQRQQAKFTPEMEKHFRANPKAWSFFEKQPPGYRRLMAWYVMSAKQDATREKRLERVIEASEGGKRVE